MEVLFDGTAGQLWIYVREVVGFGADALTIWVAWLAFSQNDPPRQDPEPPVA